MLTRWVAAAAVGVSRVAAVSFAGRGSRWPLTTEGGPAFLWVCRYRRSHARSTLVSLTIADECGAPSSPSCGRARRGSAEGRHLGTRCRPARHASGQALSDKTLSQPRTAPVDIASLLGLEIEAYPNSPHVVGRALVPRELARDHDRSASDSHAEPAIRTPPIRSGASKRPCSASERADPVTLVDVRSHRAGVRPDSDVLGAVVPACRLLNCPSKERENRVSIGRWVCA